MGVGVFGGCLGDVFCACKDLVNTMVPATLKKFVLKGK